MDPLGDLSCPQLPGCRQAVCWMVQGHPTCPTMKTLMIWQNPMAKTLDQVAHDTDIREQQTSDRGPDGSPRFRRSADQPSGEENPRWNLGFLDQIVAWPIRRLTPSTSKDYCLMTLTLRSRSGTGADSIRARMFADIRCPWNLAPQDSTSRDRFKMGGNLRQSPPTTAALGNRPNANAEARKPTERRRCWPRHAERWGFLYSEIPEAAASSAGQHDGCSSSDRSWCIFDEII